ncbi:MAG: hypothetical protein Q4C17_05275, partial [Bacillota bacterium]|nr:hypothetical protein [Bacillota bacterium]
AERFSRTKCFKSRPGKGLLGNLNPMNVEANPSQNQMLQQSHLKHQFIVILRRFLYRSPPE